MKYTFLFLASAFTLLMTSCKSEQKQAAVATTETAQIDQVEEVAEEEVAEETGTGGEMVEIDEAQFAELVADFNSSSKQYVGTGFAIVDFNATWCGPCQELKPQLQALAQKHPSVSFYSVDIDKCPNVAQAYGINSIPEVWLCFEGEVNSQGAGIPDLDKLEELLTAFESEE